MAEIYKLIHPVKYFKDYVSRDSRPDGRKFDEHRNIKLNVGALQTADSSSVVKCGNTTVICGINLADSKLLVDLYSVDVSAALASPSQDFRVFVVDASSLDKSVLLKSYTRNGQELATPRAEEPDYGFLVTNIEIPPLCSSKFRPGPPSDYAQVTSNIVSDIISNSKCVDLKDLCIAKDKLAWVLHCNIVCLNHDGSLVDSCIISLLAALKTLQLPSVTYDPETEEISVDTSTKTLLNINGLPVATSFAVYEVDQRNIILADPSMYEEEVSGGLGANLIVCFNNEQLCGTLKFGGSHLSEQSQEQSLEIAKKRSRIIAEVIDCCINNTKI